MASRIRLGAQGWNYDAWVGPFYPVGTRPADYLAVYGRAFDTVEVDSTFYAIPPASTLRSWAARVPTEFEFALKFPQEITQENRLRHSDDLTALFFDRARELGPRLGPVLIQLSPDFGPTELPALATFLPKLPRDVRIAIEFRQRSWMHEGVYALLAEHGVALALSDGRWIQRRTMLSLAERPTADFAYVRWMGPNRDLIDYSRIQIDRSRELDQWAAALKALAERGKTVYGYMNNHFAGHSPESIRSLQRRLRMSVVDPSQLGEQMSLF